MKRRSLLSRPVHASAKTCASPRHVLASAPVRAALFLAVLPALAGTADSGAHAQQEAPPPTPVRGVAVEEREVIRRERVIGSLRARQRAELAALEEGPLVAVHVREGQRIAAGEKLATVDTRRLEAERAGVAADLASARATAVERTALASEAVDELARLEKAGEGSAVSKREVERARTAVAVAEAQREASQSAVVALESRLALQDVRLGDATLVAPFDAFVVERHREGGEWVRPGDTIVTLISAARYEAWLDVPERFVGAMESLGSTLAVQLDATGQTVEATQPRRVPDVDRVARTFPLVADLTDVATTLAPGLSISAWLPVGEARAELVVPKDALLYRPGGVAVVTVPGASVEGTRAGVAIQVPVRVLFELEREVVLEPGAIEPGALVVTEGNERIFPGTPVSIQLPDTSAEAGDDPGAPR